MNKYPLLKIATSTINPSKVLIIYTGGTLGMVYDNHLKSLVPFKFEQILDNLPELQRLSIEMCVLALAKPIDSSNVSPEIWTELVNIIEHHYNDFDGFVILHGTDTMAYTASALSFLIQNLKKPIVFTGAQLPIGVPRTDARENLISSIEIAANKNNIVPEVCIYFNGKLLRGNRTKKQESSQFDAFDSENYPYLADIGVEIEFHDNNILKPNDAQTIFYKHLNVNIGLLKLYPGITAYAVEYFFKQENLSGVILETYGAGNAPSEPWFIEILQNAIRNGIFIVNISQCVGGKVIMGKYETSKDLLEMGIIPGSDLTTEAAITKLMFVLGQYKDRNEIISKLKNCLVGELSD